MNTYRLFLVALFILCLASGADKKTASAEDWRSADHSKFDASRVIHISPSVVHVRQRVILSEEALSKLRKDRAHDYSNYSHTINMKRINCRKRTIGAAGSTDYDTRGGVIQSFDEKTKLNNIQMLPVVRCSDGDAFIQAVCEYVKKVPAKKLKREGSRLFQPDSCSP